MQRLPTKIAKEATHGLHRERRDPESFHAFERSRRPAGGERDLENVERVLGIQTPPMFREFVRLAKGERRAVRCSFPRSHWTIPGIGEGYFHDVASRRRDPGVVREGQTCLPIGDGNCGRVFPRAVQ
jgi:hypothetical protein